MRTNDGSALVGTYLLVVATLPFIPWQSVSAQQAAIQPDQSQLELEEVIVTARRRAEALQDVPDAITAFTQAGIEAAGIERVNDFLSMVPNFNFQDGASFSKAYAFYNIRGIGNGQQGWAPVTFVVDGVRADSLDAINSGALIDIERIEVLRGPQSALYGAGAIAGAINVVTTQPSNQLDFRTRASFGRGNDIKSITTVSGPLVKDRLLGKLSVYYRNSDGLIDSASNGLDLDFEDMLQVSGRMVFFPSEDFALDFRAEYVDEKVGSTYQDKLSVETSIETFNDATEPRRRVAGEEDRRVARLALKASIELPWASLVSITGYSDTNQDALSGVCWDDPDDPAVDADPLTPGAQVGCLFGTAQGSSAPPGGIVDNYFDAIDDMETVTQDLRLISPDDQRLRWLAGAEIFDRDTLNGFDLGLVVAPPVAADPDVFVPLFPLWHRRQDAWWGIYAQLSYDLAAKTELTVSGRYDHTTHKSTQFADRTQTTIVPNPDPNGVLVNTLKQEDDSFQPKVQLSYDVSDALMLYATWSKGYRAGFFNTGNFTLAEHTTNYEGGLKATLSDRRLLLNASVFHIDYSDQQFSTVIPAPPFRVAVTIPESKIDGVELESAWRATELLTLSGSLGYLDARLPGGISSPQAPQWTANLAFDVVVPWANSRELFVHGDHRYTSAQFLGRNEAWRTSASNVLNLRLGLRRERWAMTLWARNALDEQYPVTEPSPLAGGIVRLRNAPRSYGVEIGYSL